MKSDKKAFDLKKTEDGEKSNFGKLSLARINSLLNNPDLSASQKRILLNILKNQGN